MQTIILSSEECMFIRFLCVEQHSFRNTTAAPAVRDVKIAVGLPQIVRAGEAKRARGPVDSSRKAFELEEDTYRGFIEVQVETSEPEAGSVFVVAKGGTQTQGPQRMWPLPSLLNDDLPLQALFIWRRCTL